MQEKLDDAYELMLAIEKFLMDNFNATINGHGTTTDFKDNEADCDVQVDGNKYNITIAKNNEEDDD